MLAELLHHRVALRLRQIAMQRVHIITVADKIVGYLLRLALRAAEYYGVNIRVCIGYALQRKIFVLCVDHIIYVAHILSPLVLRAYHEFNGAVHIILRYFCNLVGHSGREKQHLTVFRHISENAVDVVYKAHIEHLVGLVENHRMHVRQIYRSAFYQVQQTTRSGNDDMHTFFQRPYLALYARTAIYGQHLQIRSIFREIRKVAPYLQA